MGEVVRLPVRLRPIRPITAEQVEIRDALIVSLSGSCMHCAGRGFILRPINARCFYPSDFVNVPCPCGGDDENRIDVDEPDYPGAA
jgi:hypothetical protein